MHESDASVNSLQELCVYSVNIQCLSAHIDELNHHLETQKCHIVCIQETWLDKSREEPTIHGYKIVSRRDRYDGDRENRGGVLVLRRDDFNGIVHISNSAVDERSWHFVKLGVETILLGNWYRPGSSAFDGFSELYAELAEHFSEISGVLLVGDLNIHHQRWLRFSSGNSGIGSELKALCDFHGMFQIVREPTREQYLLDLAICDLTKAKATVLPKIADHKAVRIDVPIAVITEVGIKRLVWNLKSADWPGLQKELSEIDWRPPDRGTAEDSVNYFLDVLWTLLVKYIPQTEIETKRSSHPWLNARCQNAICQKNAADRTDAFKVAEKKCDDVLREEKARYVEDLKKKLAALPKNSKRWWRMNRELVQRKANIASIPPLREDKE